VGAARRRATLVPAVLPGQPVTLVWAATAVLPGQPVTQVSAVRAVSPGRPVAQVSAATARPQVVRVWVGARAGPPERLG